MNQVRLPGDESEQVLTVSMNQRDTLVVGVGEHYANTSLFLRAYEPQLSSVMVGYRRPGQQIPASPVISSTRHGPRAKVHRQGHVGTAALIRPQTCSVMFMSGSFGDQGSSAMQRSSGRG